MTAYLKARAADMADGTLVRAGDTLFGIAQKANAALADLLRVNYLTPRAVIQPGLRLRLP